MYKLKVTDDGAITGDLDHLERSPRPLKTFPRPINGQMQHPNHLKCNYIDNYTVSQKKFPHLKILHNFVKS